MAISYPDWRAILIALTLSPAAAAQDTPILLDAATTDFDRGKQRLLFEEVSIKRGTLGISADRADTSQLDFADSVWVFQGSVKIYSDNADVTAQRAEMEFVDHQLQRATITGSPALLSHANDASMNVRATEAVVTFNNSQLNNVTLRGQPAEFEHTADNTEAAITKGTAGRLIYDLERSTITLADDAWVAQGDNEIRGEEIVYDIVAQRIVAGGDQNGDRVRITITPPPSSETTEDDSSQ
ncbi:MAG: lipopolysaccharide transport periplasmic protein LptA [Gammaproteobacteria bacterium]|nr:lipopolysaccharide transport periplasmic protein LptA [Gammaproteobacteria bacterium]